MKQTLIDKESFKREIMETVPIPLEQLLLYLVDRVITKDEKIFGKYLKIEPFEKKEIGLKVEQYTYLLVTTRNNFIILFACPEMCWYKVCSLSNFKTLQERYLSSEIITKKNIEFFLANRFPGKLTFEIYFDVTDETLQKIKLEGEERIQKERIKAFVDSLTTVLCDLHKK